MVRSAAAVLAVLILPTLAQGQEPVGTHTVVDDDTLWDLAQLYYRNPFEWRVIWEANRDSIADPNLIYPNEVFVIPGLPSRTAVADRGPAPTTIETEPQAVAPAGGGVAEFGFRQARPSQQSRTIFYQDTATQTLSTVGARQGAFYAVTRDAVYSAPWVEPFGVEPAHTGVLEGFADEGGRASTIRIFDDVRMTMPSAARVGARLQIFRVMRDIESVGQVVVPTGVISVTSIGSEGVFGEVVEEYQRIQPGDFVRPVPEYTVPQGVRARDVEGGSEAMIMGFAGRQVLNDLGHIAFLDLGSEDGIVIGDEFVLYGATSADDSRGRLQVVGTTPNMAAARITSLADDVFRQGVVVRLARKMP